MTINIFLYIYTIAGLTGLLTMLLISLIRNRTSCNRSLLSKIGRFVLCTALLDILYLYIEYSGIRSGCLSASAPPVARTADILLYIGQVYYWCSYLHEKSSFEEVMKPKTRPFSASVLIIMIAASIAVYGFILDDFYYAGPGTELMISVMFEAALSIYMTAVLVLNLLKAYSSSVPEKIKKIILFISVLISTNNIWNATIAVMMMTASPLSEKILCRDPSSMMIFIINVLTMMLIHYEDFSELFRLKTPGTGSRVENISDSHGLTIDEHEILGLICKGLTVSEISVKLKIPQYTVRLIMNDICQKLDVSDREEIIYLVNQPDIK